MILLGIYALTRQAIDSRRAHAGHRTTPPRTWQKRRGSPGPGVRRPRTMDPFRERVPQRSDARAWQDRAGRDRRERRALDERARAFREASAERIHRSGTAYA